MTSSSLHREILERGYASLGVLYDDDTIAGMLDAVRRKYARLGRPPTWANPPSALEPDVETAEVGLIFHHVGNHFPEIVEPLCTLPVIDALKDVLGDTMRLEYTSVVVNAQRRPFFRWHMHIGGVDNVHYRRRRDFPRFDRPQRLATLLYLCDLTSRSGTLRILPRRVTDPTQPPYELDAPDWPDHVELSCPKGSVVLLDQATWHSAGPMNAHPLRAFVACYWAASDADEVTYYDRSLDSYAQDIPHMAPHLPADRAPESRR